MHTKLLLLSLLLGFIHQATFAQSSNAWELDLNQNFKTYFEEAYQLYPDIPRGILESVAYTNSHIRHIRPEQEMPSCVGLPFYYGVMGLVADGKEYFRPSLAAVVQYSHYAERQIKNDPRLNILAYAEAYHQLKARYQIKSQQVEDHIFILDALSELPNDGQVQNNFAFDSHIYSLFQNLNQAKFQAVYQLPNYQIDLEKLFGKERLAILSAATIRLDAEQIQTQTGLIYQQTGQRSAPPACSDISSGFPYPIIANAAHSSNYSSRAGRAISHITIHTMQGSYAGSISWFKNPAANVSAHYNIRSSDGQITQSVCEIDKAWHVSNSNPYTVGIEHEGYVADASWYSQNMYVASAALSKDIAVRNGIPHIRTYDINGDNGLNPISDGCFKIKGHQHFPSQTHIDPGQYWDWNRYYDLINGLQNAPSHSMTNCSATFYDSGGAAGNYANDERTFYRIEPTGATSVTLRFTAFNLETNYDYLYIYDGDSPNDPLLAVLNGQGLPPNIVAQSGKMLLEFRTDCGTTASGWVANYTCSMLAPSCAMSTGLAESQQNHNATQLHWNATAGAAAYQIKYKRSLAASYTTIYSTTNQANISGLAAGALYFWSVRAICGSGDTSVANGKEFVNAVSVSDINETNCTGLFTDSGGEIGEYSNREDYTFTIAPTGATAVQLTFSSFDLENNYDFMYIYDGATTAANLLGTYTGNSLPPVIHSTGAALTVRFTSDNRTRGDGWAANWSCTAPSLPVYNNPILLNTTTIGNLDCSRSYHDFFDSGNATAAYSNNENHTMIFCNPDTSQSVRLSFRPNPTAAQQLSISNTSTGNDYLYFYNGDSSLNNLIGTYTGASTSAPQPGSYVSSQACLTVKMNSDNNFVGDGFVARLYCANRPTRLPTVYVGGTAGAATFADNGGLAANYANNSNYIVTYCPHASAAAGEAVWASFVGTIGIEQNWDYLYIFDGDNTETARLICSYTGNSSHQNILKTIKATVANSSGCLTFQFFSDVGTTASGWEANITTAAPRLPFGGATCSTATPITASGEFYAGSTALHTGTPSSDDPSLHISLANLPECSGANAITRLENTSWYQFTTPTTACVVQDMKIRFDNISCQSENSGGSGVQFVLYQANQCAVGTQWGQPLYCADKLLTGDSIDIRGLLQPNTSYYIMIDGFTGQNCNFDIKLDLTGGNNCSLALDWLDFFGTDLNTSIRLDWLTANEEDVAGFQLQRAKANGIDFEDIAYIGSKVNNNGGGAAYDYNDAYYWRNQVNYYRLKEIDINGIISYSNTISIDKRTAKNTIKLDVFPNPAKNWVTFALNSPQEMAYKLKIYDITGRILLEEEGEIPLGYWTAPFSTQDLAAGVYVYKLTIGTQTINGKFEKY